MCIDKYENINNRKLKDPKINKIRILTQNKTQQLTNFS